jgi:hypothetical protein
MSIKRLINRMLNPKVNKSGCMYLLHKSQVIRSRIGDESYIDTSWFCTKLQKRITKRYCHDCQVYKPLDYKNESIR